MSVYIYIQIVCVCVLCVYICIHLTFLKNGFGFW